MITNERQYAITKAEAAKFRDALSQSAAAGVDPQMHKLMVDGARSQLEELEEQLAEYETLRAGKVRKFSVGSVAGIGLALVKARIARQLTQRALAERLNVHEQQIQRYEATHYAGASIERVQEVADVLKVRISEQVTLERD